MSSQHQQSQHGNAIVLGCCGIVVLGASGSGKSRLSHKLIESWNLRQEYARWVADDRLIVELTNGSYVVKAPSSLRGQAERRFSGIETVEWQSSAVVDLIVQLLPTEKLERMPELSNHQLVPGGPATPLLVVPQYQFSQAIELIEARLAPESPNP